MSSADVALMFNSVSRRVRATETRPVLRLALYPGELVKIPRARQHLHVLSGTAWVSTDGRDTVAPLGSCMDLAGARYPALVSGLGGNPLLFEVW